MPECTGTLRRIVKALTGRGDGALIEIARAMQVRRIGQSLHTVIKRIFAMKRQLLSARACRWSGLDW